MEKKKNIGLLKILNIIIIILTIEKMIQHLLTALFFIIDIPGIGTPDIGDNFLINNITMSILNIIYFIIFGIGFIAKTKQIKWGILLIIIFAGLDIILEFLFHGLFFITISVIVSTMIIITSIIYFKKNDTSYNRIVE